MIVIQTTIDHRAMTALARMTRKTMRRGRNGPVRVLAWFAVLLEGYLTAIYLRAGVGGWHVNALLGGIMLACILGEDRVNGAIGLRRTPPDSREVNTAFQEKESCYVCRAQLGSGGGCTARLPRRWRQRTTSLSFWTESRGRYSTSGASPGAPWRS